MNGYTTPDSSMTDPEAGLRAAIEQNDPMPVDLAERMVKRVRQEIEGEAA